MKEPNDKPIRKVAIVDDDSIFQFTTKIKIEKSNLADNVVFFNDGHDMLSYLESAEEDDLPQLILLDINMPITDGWDFIDAFGKLSDAVRDNIKIFMISSSINPIDLRKAMSSDYIEDYITKPIRDTDLEKIFGKK